eukprot:2345610-Amphidinium_carterae.2
MEQQCVVGVDVRGCLLLSWFNVSALQVYLNIALRQSGILDMLAGGMSDVKALERYGNITLAEESQSRDLCR